MKKNIETTHSRFSVILPSTPGAATEIGSVENVEVALLKLKDPRQHLLQRIREAAKKSFLNGIFIKPPPLELNGSQYFFYKKNPKKRINFLCGFPYQ